MTETTSQRFTATTWKTLQDDQSYLSGQYARSHGLYWEHLHDLGADLAERDDNPLTFDQTRTLVDLCVSGTPIVLTWVTRHREFVETTTATVVVEYVGTQYAQVHYCGFSHPVYLTEITGVEVPETVRTYVYE